MSDDRHTDPFAPPEISTEVCCIHCGETYDSWQIEWRLLTNRDGEERGFWCCPMPGCDGMGFGFDILPTDPNYHDEHGGWIHCDDEDEEFDEDGEFECLDELCGELGDLPDDLGEAESGFTEFDLDFESPQEEADGNRRRRLGDDWPFSMN
jgi:hypothetical protein